MAENREIYFHNTHMHEQYRRRETNDVIHLNDASLARPTDAVVRAVESQVSISEYEARKIAAELVSLREPERVLFARNTTEATAFATWIASARSGTSVYSNFEHHSIKRVVQENRDHGNTNQQDIFCTYPDEKVRENIKAPEGIEHTNAKTLSLPLNTPYRFASMLPDDVSLVTVSHVSREDGSVVDVANYARAIKELHPQAWFFVDGSQALGNLSYVDFDELEHVGVDFYSATPHKSLGSYPLGILYISRRATANINALEGKRTIEQIIMTGMIDPAHNISPNTDTPLHSGRYASLYGAIRSLKEQNLLSRGSFFEKVQQQQNHHFLAHALLGQRRIPTLGRNTASSIVSFRVPNEDQRSLVLKLQERNCFSSYIQGNDSIRISFGLETSKETVKQFFEKLDKLVQ